MLLSEHIAAADHHSTIERSLVKLLHEEPHAGSKIRLQQIDVVHTEPFHEMHAQVFAGTIEPLLGKVVKIVDQLPGNQHGIYRRSPDDGLALTITTLVASPIPVSPSALDNCMDTGYGCGFAKSRSIKTTGSDAQ